MRTVPPAVEADAFPDPFPSGTVGVTVPPSGGPVAISVHGYSAGRAPMTGESNCAIAVPTTPDGICLPLTGGRTVQIGGPSLTKNGYVAGGLRRIPVGRADGESVRADIEVLDA